ncbi:cytidylyltransferase domain-containing protein [Jeotgalibacillus sp. R-1-5s-1]|uniref:cytidylyltransferase domain-containing protein n=1 Tax=Jeotgalibacillus sp. R-1-5s-1 TaxID=2555897 RepID=UPI00106A59D4|nr:glycosyltransferase family protein [Jeotgalibacillus sp. R-1-5s-1]TFD95795.1 acylneuraminate cytidylyltransferase [Jeotgalibacillus sp. R-1-5s-1]
MKITAIIQTRMGSTRLPGKVLKKLGDKTVLAHVIERVSQSTEVDDIIIATTENPEDHQVVDEALKAGVKVFRGSESDVLSRYYYAAKQNNTDVVVRITSDCPLIDPNIIDEMIKLYINESYDIVTNAGSDISQRTYPRGLDAEIFSFGELKNAFSYAKEPYQLEHVTPYLYENSNNIYIYKHPYDYSMYRWTLDTNEDFNLITEIYKRLYRGEHSFYLNDIIQVFKKEADLFAINKHIEQKKIN